MKRLLLLSFIVAGSLFASSAYSQVYVHARINLPVPPLPPIPHVHVYAQPQVVYESYPQPAAQYYPEYGRERVAIADRDYRYRRDNYNRGYENDRRRERDRRHEDYREHRDHERDRRNW